MIKNILHVEDNKDTRTAVKLMLKGHGFNVVGAANGKECLNLLEKEKPDIILLDIMMPDMSGWDVFQKIIKNKQLRRTKVVFLSVLPVLDKKIREMYKRGIAGYIMKPFTEQELVGKIKKLTKEKKKPTAKDFIKRIELKKDKAKILSEVISDLVIFQTIKEKDFSNTRELIKKVLPKLKALAGHDSIYSFLPADELKLIENKINDKQELFPTIQKELLSRFSILGGSLSLYSTLSRWKQMGLVKSTIIGKTKLYALTKKGIKMRQTLLNYFIKLHEEL